MKANRKRDAHNYYPTIKCLIDGFVKAGIWPDDNDEWVSTREPKFSTTAAQIVVTITPREAT